MEADKTAVVDAQCEFQGKLTGRDARILGRFRGDIERAAGWPRARARGWRRGSRPTPPEIAGEFVGEIFARSVTLTRRPASRQRAGRVLSRARGRLAQGAVNTGVAHARPASCGGALRRAAAASQDRCFLILRSWRAARLRVTGRWRAWTSSHGRHRARRSRRSHLRRQRR